MSRRFVVVFLVLGSILFPHAAQAQYATETGPLSVGDATVGPGDEVSISGSGFEPGSRLEVTIESDPVTLGSTRADGQGRFAMTVSIPAGITSGVHTLKATGVTPDGATLVLSSTITIVGGAGNLVRTGTDVGTIATAGVVMVAVAVGSLLALRRRRRPQGSSS